MSSNPKNPSPEPNSPRSHTIGIRVPLSLYEELTQAAADDGRKVANYVLRLIEADLNQRLLDLSQSQPHETAARRALPKRAPRYHTGPEPPLTDRPHGLNEPGIEPEKD
mgnify:CR=1 FL=1